MALDLDLELHLEDRDQERVLVAVWLAPQSGSCAVDGVALQLTDAHGQPLGPQVLLPISGTVSQPMRTTVALSPEEGHGLPRGSMATVTAWHGSEQREASVPTDPATDFEAHVRGVACPEEVEAHPDRMLEPLLPEERVMLSIDYPWINEPRVRSSAAQLGVVDHVPSTEEAVDDFAADMGLDEESADWLKELLEE